MDEEAEERRAAGETALLVTVPEADPLLSGVRRAYDPAGAAGVPAHVTVLYPFLPAARIDPGVHEELRGLFAGHAPFTLEFARFGRFPDLLWLAPEPDGPLRALTAAVTARWPEALPYAGRYGDPVPHLTLAGDGAQEVYDAMERALAAGLPLRTRVAGVHLVAYDGARWRLRETFPLTGVPG